MELPPLLSWAIAELEPGLAGKLSNALNTKVIGGGAVSRWAVVGDR